MTTKPIELLKELYWYESVCKYPNIPNHARTIPKCEVNTANGLTKCIIDFIRMNNGQAERISNTGRQIDNRQVITDVVGRTRIIGSVAYIKGSGTNGTADISATIKGRSVKIEVKIGRDKQSADQLKYQKNIELAGGLYFIAKDFDTFYEWYHLIFGNNGK